MAQVKISNLVKQNEPRPLPRKSKILQSTQDKNRNDGHMVNVENTKGERFKFPQRFSVCRSLPEGNVPVKSFDETPITVTNKSFSQLLEEKLTDTLPANPASSQRSKPKKSFLRKGDGLAKFQPKQYSRPSSVPKCSVTDYEIQHTKKNGVTDSVTDKHEPRTVKTFLRKGSGLKRFRLKPITGSRKHLCQSRRISNQETNNCIEHKNWNPESDNISNKKSAQVTKDAKTLQTVQHRQVKDARIAVDECLLQVNEKQHDGQSFNHLYEDKVQDEFEELRAFELLEQQAANSSFSSNCSFVSRILQISTQPSFNVNHYGTEEVQAHAHFIPVDPVQTKSSTVSTGVIKQRPELHESLQCTKEQLSDVARNIAFLREDMFNYSVNHQNDEDYEVEQNSCSEVPNFIKRISHLHKSMELRDCQEREAGAETLQEKETATSNILHGGQQEQIRILIDDLQEIKHCNSDTECSFLSETLCVRFTEDPYMHLEKEQTKYCAQKSTHTIFESDKWGNSECSYVDQEAYEITNLLNKREIPKSTCKPSSEREYQHTNETHTHKPGDSEDINLLKSDLLQKRLIELDAEISLYNEEKLKLYALRKEYDIIIQELVSEKETLKNLISKERAAIKMEREEIAAERFHLEQYKSELMNEKQFLEGLKQLADLKQNIEEKEHQIQSEHLRDQYLIKRLQRENDELKTEIMKLKNNENLFRKSRSSVNRLKVGEKMKFISAVPSQMNGVKKQDVENPLEICDIVPKRCIPLAAHKNPTEAQLRKTLKGKREVSTVDIHNGDKKFYPESARKESNKGKVINAASNLMKDLGNENEDDDNTLVIHEVVPRKPLPSAVEEDGQFQSIHKVCENIVAQTSEEGNVHVYTSHLHTENCDAKLIDTVPSKMKDHKSDDCNTVAQLFINSETVEGAPEDEFPSAQNVALTITNNENVINSLLNKKPAGSNNFQTRNMRESAAVKRTVPEKGSITDLNDAGTTVLKKYDSSNFVTQASNVSTVEFSADINILDDNLLTPREIIPSKLHCADKNVDAETISCDRVTHIKSYPDGRKEIWYNNGCVCKISSDGMSEKIIYYNGDVLERCLKSKTEKYYFCKSKIWCTTYEDKTQLVEFSNGQTELKKPDGTITTNYINGASQTVFPDGRVEWVLNDGRQCTIEQTGEKTWNFPNGQKEIHTKDHKRREYPDGTIKYVFPDGSMKTKYANGRIREKDKYGNLVMDSDLQ